MRVRMWLRAACVVATVGLAASVIGAQQGDGPAQAAASPAGRLNQVIERFEQGLPSFNNQHWRYLAMEHAPYDAKEVAQLLKTLKPAGASRPTQTPIIRIPPEGNEGYRWMIKQVLDVGVMGVILSHVQTKDEALRFVRSMRYPPQRGAQHPEPVGERGWGPTGATAYWGFDNRAYTLQKADVWPLNPGGELLAIVMVETKLGVKNINEILSTPGLAGVLVGPSDLSMDMGVGPDPTAPEVEAATEVVAKACVAKKMLCGTFQAPPKDVPRRIAQGFRLFTGAAGDYSGK